MPTIRHSDGSQTLGSVELGFGAEAALELGDAGRGQRLDGSHRRTASAPRGALEITGPKKLPSRSPWPGANVRIGVPTFGPVRDSASSVSERR